MPSAKFDVDISSFKSGIQSAKNEVKTLDQQMKLIDATFKNTGNSEQALANKTQTLNSRMAAQKNMAAQAEAALKAMTEAGVDPASDAYQRMAREMLMAQTGMQETQLAMNELGNGAVTAAGGVEQLETGLRGISKKISLDQVINGISKITTGLETAAKKAVSLGKSIFDNIMDAAQWADDTSTMAMMYGIDLDTFQRMQKLVVNGMDTSVEAILKSQSKLKKGIGDDSKATMDALKELGLGLRSGNILDPYGWTQRDPVDMFWEAGQALMALGDEYEKESKAQALFGRSWHELVPLFSEYKNAEEFANALSEVYVNSGESMGVLSTFSDKMGELRGNFDTLSREIIAQFAPGLISLSDSLNELLKGVMDYLKTEDGQAMLKSMSDSFLGLFDGLRNISVEDAVGKFKEMFDSIVSGFRWVSENGETLMGVLQGIGVFWAGLKVSEGALTLLKLVNGLKDLMSAGTAAGAAGASTATGITTWLMGGLGKIADVLGNTQFQSAAPAIGDWLVHNTGLGQELILGTKEKGSTWEEIKQNVIDYGDTLMSVAQNNYQYWENIKKQQQEAGEWILGDEATAEDAMNFVLSQTHPEVTVEPKVSEGSAAEIAAQIGTITVYVEPIVGDPVNKTDIRRRNNSIPGYANGISFVPDTRLAWLHPGEEVRTAREVGARTFNSNMYFQNVVMNNGQDADGMAARIVAAQRREISGFGG